MENHSLFIFAGISLFYSVMTSAESIDWLHATEGLHIEQGIAYSGCSPAISLSDQRAHKLALLRAHANIVRAKHANVSGEEHISIDGQGRNVYLEKVFEETGGYLRPVVVVSEEVTQIDNQQQLCLLAIEGK